MRLLGTFAAIGLITISFIAAPGCGGSGGNSSSFTAPLTTGPTIPAVQGVGRATFTIHWPTLSPSRLIPSASKSIVVKLTRPDETSIAGQRVERPVNGGTTTMTFDNVPTGEIIVRAHALPNANGTGTFQATAAASVSIEGGKTTTLSLTLESTIDRLEVTPSSPSMTVGQTVPLIVTAKNRAGLVVLTDPANTTFRSLDSSLATTFPAIVSREGEIKAFVPGTMNVVITETESGKTATIPVSVAAPSSPPPVSPAYTGTGNIVANVSSLGLVMYTPLVFTLEGVRVSAEPTDFGPEDKFGGIKGPRDMAVGSEGELHIYRGEFPAVLTTWYPKTKTWKTRTFPGWSTIARSFYGGVAAYGKYVFVSDMKTASLGGEPKGIIRFDTATEQAQRFSEDFDCTQLTIGFDGKLYGLGEGYKPYTTEVRVFHPETLQLERSLALPDHSRSIAVNRQGDIFVVSDETNRISRYTSTGQLLATSDVLQGTPYDLNLSLSSVLVAGSRSGIITVLSQDMTILRSFPVSRFTSSGTTFVTLDEAVF